MKFFKNHLLIFTTLSILASSIAYPMNKEGDDEPNMITPYIAPAASLAMARYGSEIASATMPRMFPENQLANALVPSTLKYGGYALGGYLIAKNIGLKPDALLNKQNLKTGAQVALSAAPALLCHPQVANAAHAYAKELAIDYLSKDNAALVDNYGKQALIATGALGTLYLLNKNVPYSNLLKKAKKLAKDSRPYLFIAPLIATYNRDVLKDALCNQLPTNMLANIKNDVGWCIDKTLLVGGLGITGYLLATQTFGMTTNGYLKKKIEDLKASLDKIGAFITDKLGKRTDALVENAKNVADAAQKLNENVAIYALIHEKRIKALKENIDAIAATLYKSKMTVAQQNDILQVLKQEVADLTDLAARDESNAQECAAAIDVLEKQLNKLIELANKEDAHVTLINEYLAQIKEKRQKLQNGIAQDRNLLTATLNDLQKDSK